jgi:hypothetical protein
MSEWKTTPLAITTYSNVMMIANPIVVGDIANNTRQVSGTVRIFIPLKWQGALTVSCELAMTFQAHTAINQTIMYITASDESEVSECSVEHQAQER